MEQAAATLAMTLCKHKSMHVRYRMSWSQYSDFFLVKLYNAGIIQTTEMWPFKEKL